MTDKNFVPVEKMSKKAQREYFKKKRNTWGTINPVTKKSTDPKVYNRKKFNTM